jgi:RNAse (barnase) inhibitor barstar
MLIQLRRTDSLPRRKTCARVRSFYTYEELLEMSWKWDSTYDEDENLDWLIMRAGPISKYFSAQILDQNLRELEKLRYQLIDVSASRWTSKNVYDEIGKTFNFPDYFGKNLNALDDCLSDLFNPRYKGLVVVIRNFDRFYEENKNLADDILDVFCAVSWEWLLAERKLIVFLQSNDADLEIRKVGGWSPRWNASEWLDSDRKQK